MPEQDQPKHQRLDESSGPAALGGDVRRFRRRKKRRSSSGKLPASANIKLALLITSVVIVLGTLFYAHQLVVQLRQREYKVARLFADAFKYYSTAETSDDSLYRM